MNRAYEPPNNSLALYKVYVDSIPIEKSYNLYLQLYNHHPYPFSSAIKQHTSVYGSVIHVAFTFSDDHIRNIPKLVSGIGALAAALRLRDKTRLVSAGSITPSSHNL